MYNKQFLYEDKLPNKFKKALTNLLLLLAIAAIVWTVRSVVVRNKEQQNLEAFYTALGQEKYIEALAQYHEVQSIASNREIAEEERIKYRSLQIQMEEKTHELIQSQIVDQLLIGEWDPQNAVMVSSLKELSSAYLSPWMAEQTEKLLDGELEAENWHFQITSLSEADNLMKIGKDLLAQENCFIEQIGDFARAEAKEREPEWKSAWYAWQDLAENQDICRFAREYASFHLKSYQEEKYNFLLEECKKMLNAEQYVSAYQLLSELVEVFPEREELKSLLLSVSDRTALNLEIWKGDVPVFSIRPLVVRPELAFTASHEASYADSALIGQSEFRRFLEQLYAEDYVLISITQFFDWPERRVNITVPEGKKPCLLIFDRWQYTVLNQSCGTAQRLLLDEQGKLLAEAGEKQGRDLDAITILEDFIAEHPDFSFNGAKALISLNVYENTLGYITNPEQNEHNIEAWQRVDIDFPKMTEEEFREAKSELHKVVKYLKENGFDFSSSGYRGYDMGNLELSELQEELEKWKEECSELGDTRVLSFPNGSHVYGQTEKLELCLTQGFNIFLGEGPKPYLFYEGEYLHLERMALNLSSLSATSGQLYEYLNLEGVIDKELRGIEDP